MFSFLISDYIIMAQERPTHPKLRIKLKSYDIKMLESSVAKMS